MSAKTGPILTLFSERKAELSDPVSAMRAMSRQFENHKASLADVPIKLQIGRDGEAIQSILAFVELFNKTNRILPELGFHGIEGDSIRPDGKKLKDFYEAINTVLKQMMDAFERKDSVLLGDLVEYEIVPRMSGFFSALDNAMAAV
jgi:hypothetical protein